MCGRYYIEIDEDEMLEIIREVQRKADRPEQLVRTGEIFPTNIAPVMVSEHDFRSMKWGFLRYDGKGHVINARSETVYEKSMFRKPLFEGRCLIPASNYFEWLTDEHGKKHKYAIKTATPVSYMAGLYRSEKGNDIPTFVILTKAAAPEIEFIHNRMPVILDKAAQISWLSGNIDGVFDNSMPPHKYEKVAKID